MSEWRAIEILTSLIRSKCPNLELPIGDDAALLGLPAGAYLTCMDTLNEGVHFPVGESPEHIAYKALAVNLSDLAAMGSGGGYATLSLSMPSYNEAWLEAFASGFAELAREEGVVLVGGDTTRGPLSVTVNLLAAQNPAGVLSRSGANAGDRVFVSGNLGDAALALRCLHEGKVAGKEHMEYLLGRLRRPEPRNQLGRWLADKATACIDISDGLAGDLGHILAASGVGAEINRSFLPASPAFSEGTRQVAIDGVGLQLQGGDDYELCFTLPAGKYDEEILDGFGCTCIGVITERRGLWIKDKTDPTAKPFHGGAYEHFG